MISKYTARSFCKDDISKIENYELAISDMNRTWYCHHRLELTMCNEFAHNISSLKRLGMYYNRPYFELIFLTEFEHKSLHSKAKSDETRRNTSNKLKGIKRSAETIEKFKLAKSNIPQEVRDKISNTLKGHHNITYSGRARISEACKRRVGTHYKKKIDNN